MNFMMNPARARARKPQNSLLAGLLKEPRGRKSRYRHAKKRRVPSPCVLLRSRLSRGYCRFPAALWRALSFFPGPVLEWGPVRSLIWARGTWQTLGRMRIY